jgi:serine phosphatase RsbU (regulator of sigma subunit)
VLVTPDGTVRLLETRAETLLGTRGTVVRSDHSVELAPGTSVIFYTDGLVERRGATLDDGLAELTRVLDGCAGMTAEELSDHLLAHFAAGTEDDVVLAVVRTLNQDPPGPSASSRR